MYLCDVHSHCICTTFIQAGTILFPRLGGADVIFIVYRIVNESRDTSSTETGSDLFRCYCEFAEVCLAPLFTFAAEEEVISNLQNLSCFQDLGTKFRKNRSGYYYSFTVKKDSCVMLPLKLIVNLRFS